MKENKTLKKKIIKKMERGWGEEQKARHNKQLIC